MVICAVGALLFISSKAFSRDGCTTEQSKGLYPLLNSPPAFPDPSEQPKGLHPLLYLPPVFPEPSLVPSSKCTVSGVPQDGGCANGGQCYLGYCVCGPGFEGPDCESVAGPDSAAEACKKPWIGEYCDWFTKKAHFVNPGTHVANTWPPRNLCVGEHCFNMGAEFWDVCHYWDCVFGSTRIDDRRWKWASIAELNAWGGNVGSDDRSLEISEGFEGYRTIEGMHFHHMAEVGCGPWTQSKFIIEKVGLTVNEITLYDPLAVNYTRDVPKCSYKDGKLLGKIPVTLVTKGGEEFKPEKPVDLLVMINVVEHAYNVFTILQNCFNSLRPGGIFVLHERTFDEKIAAYSHVKGIVPFWDRLHPIIIRMKILEILIDKFETLYLNDAALSKYRWDSPFGKPVFFIGKKK